MKLSDIYPGEYLIVTTSAYPCLREGYSYLVHEDEDGNLFINCESGVHLLDPIIENDNELYGFEPSYRS